jgi:hypothetical protein
MKEEDTFYNRDLFYENPPAEYSGEFFWKFFYPAYPNQRMRPTDIDCAIERRGHFIFIESKMSARHPNKGQQIMYRALVRLGKGKVRVITIYGKTPQTIKEGELWMWRDGDVWESGLLHFSSFGLVTYIRKWFEWIDGRKYDWVSKYGF